jgi:hypothetical protein
MRDCFSSYVLIASCADDQQGTGGVYSFDGNKVSKVDSVNTMSITSQCGALVRLLWSPPGGHAALAAYDCYGLSCYRRLDGHGDAHHITPYLDGYLVASTGTNSIIRISSDLAIVHQWKIPGDGDAWHLNGVFVDEERIFVSAFGRFQGHRGWHGKIDGAGIIFELETGFDVITHLCAPHHPKMIDRKWYVCNSAKHQLLVIDPSSGECLSEIDLGGWTRGIVETEDHVFVGISSPRYDANRRHGSASIVALCRRKLEVLDRFYIPALEIADLSLVATELVTVIPRRGRGENAQPTGI